MTLLIQQEMRVPVAEQDSLEEHGRAIEWPALLHLGAPMVAFGRWAFGGPGDVLVTNTTYADFDHWMAARPGGALRYDAALLAELRDRVTDGELNAEHPALEHAEFPATRVFELDSSASRPQPFLRRPRQRLVEQPPNFGRGSVISERTLAIADGQRGEFTRLSREVVWPWLESQGGRLIGIGHELMGASNEVTTWFAFRSITEWYRFARPTTANAPSEVANSYNARANLVLHQRGRILQIETDWGAHEGSGA